MYKWLRSFGWLGGLIANMLQFIAAWQGVAVSIVATAVIGYCNSLLSFAESDSVQTLAKVFLFFLWTCIGLSYLKNRNKTQTVKVEHDFAYSLIPEGGWKANLAKFEKNHVHADQDAIIIFCMFRNVSSGTIKIKLEDLRVIIDGKTSDHTEAETIFPKMAPKGIRCGPICRDKNKSQLFGTAEIKIVYGGVDGEYTRRYTLKCDIQIIVDTKLQAIAHISDTVKYEKDELIKYI